MSLSTGPTKITVTDAHGRWLRLQRIGARVYASTARQRAIGIEPGEAGLLSVALRRFCLEAALAKKREAAAAGRPDDD